MKRLENFKKLIWVGVCTLFIVSCEQPDSKADFINTNPEESFISTTGNSDTFINKDISEVVKPLLHMSFDKDLSEEEASAKFDKAIEAYLTKNKNQNKGTSIEWLYRIWNYTGTNNYNDTDGSVRAFVGFNTSRGEYYHTNVILDNSGDDREGGWDYYLIQTNFSQQEVTWIELKNAFIQLQGTDGWYLKSYYLLVLDSDQILPAIGSSTIVSEAEVWLDNTCDLCWDTFSTGNIATGRLDF